MVFKSSFQKGLSVILVALVLAGCASRADNISAAYVSPTGYMSYTCPQLREEAARVSARATQLTGAQNDKATSDAVATTVGVVLFWPALFFIKGDSTTAAELSRLKGEMEAIEQANIKLNCGIRFARPS
ncbi:hypothetical protein [Prosthecomicrobium sp. N25]|uniref:hypothetical protein n=1 Tax=Prosthecomicrobium sp. N25 TaxID=3129254 RepID=UPI00307800A7